MFMPKSNGLLFSSQLESNVEVTVKLLCNTSKVSGNPSWDFYVFELASSLREPEQLCFATAVLCKDLQELREPLVRSVWKPPSNMKIGSLGLWDLTDQ